MTKGVYSQIIHLTERLNRFDALTDAEVDWLETALRLEAVSEGRGQNRVGMKKTWQIADLRKLKRMLGQGVKVPHIANKLGRTLPAVQRKMRKEGLRCIDCRQGTVAIDVAAE